MGVDDGVAVVVVVVVVVVDMNKAAAAESTESADDDDDSEDGNEDDARGDAQGISFSARFLSAKGIAAVAVVVVECFTFGTLEDDENNDDDDDDDDDDDILATEIPSVALRFFVFSCCFFDFFATTAPFFLLFCFCFCFSFRICFCFSCCCCCCCGCFAVAVFFLLVLVVEGVPSHSLVFLLQQLKISPISRWLSIVSFFFGSPPSIGWSTHLDASNERSCYRIWTN